MNLIAKPDGIPLIVGAYAALPSDRGAQEAFYAGLSERGLATGLELPFRDCLAEEPDWLARQLQGRFTGSIITLIPGTMVRVGRDAVFGLASPDAAGRLAARAYVRRAREEAEDLNQRTGQQSVSVLHIHTAPSVTATSEAFARSLGELADDGTWSTRLVLEHCDAYSPEFPGEKRFLPLDAELGPARDAGIRITVNWGRSAVEAQSAARPGEHIRLLAEAGLLEGVMFSGAGAEANQYGGPWADAHLPLTEDESTSLMDSDEVLRCLRDAGDGLAYAGVKIQVPADATVQQRLDLIEHGTRLLQASRHAER